MFTPDRAYLLTQLGLNIGRRGLCFLNTAHYRLTMNDGKGDEGEERSKEPLGRRGACSFIHNDKFYLYSGYSGGPALTQRSKAELSVLDLTSGCWSTEQSKGQEIPECISGCCCAVVNDCLYVFGGWLAGFRNAAVYELQLDSLTWRELIAKNLGRGPILKDKAGMVGYGKHMLCVFGGYGYPSWEHGAGQSGASYHPDEESGGAIFWTNELHLFNVPSCRLSINRVLSDIPKSGSIGALMCIVRIFRVVECI